MPEGTNEATTQGPRINREVAGSGRGDRTGSTASRRSRIAGGHINIPTVELSCVWGLYQKGGPLKALDVRTWLAAREVAERRKFAAAGREPVYRAPELSSLVGGADPRHIRASLRKLERLGILRWEGPWLRFIESPENLTHPDNSSAFAMQAAMPKGRRSFPLPRRTLRLLAGGVKRCVLAAALGHLVTLPHFTRGKGWNGEGSCHGPWLCETFSISPSSLHAARTHLIEELGWMRRVEKPQWHINRFGGRFELSLDWNPQTPAAVGEGTQPELSTAKSGGPPAQSGAVSGGPESQHTSPTEIQLSDLGGQPPQAPADSSKLAGGGKQAKSLPAPRLTGLIREDLPSVARVMELFDQALVHRRWRDRGWTPQDSYLERLNWAAAARRAHVRGCANPCGVFIHLVTKRKWSHISNDDEDAVRSELARWMNPESQLDLGGGGQRPKRKPRQLSADGKALRHVERALARHGIVTSAQEVNRELSKLDWSATRIAEARASLEAWKSNDVSDFAGVA